MCESDLGFNLVKLHFFFAQRTHSLLMQPELDAVTVEVVSGVTGQPAHHV